MKKIIIVLLIIILLAILGYAVYNIIGITQEHKAEQIVYDELDNLINQAIQDSNPNSTTQPTMNPEIFITLPTETVEHTDIPVISDDPNSPIPTPKPTAAPINNPPVFTKAAWQKLYGINNHFVGYLAFDSGLIKEPIVQCSNNTYYLNHDIYRQYHAHGTVFMYHKNSLDDMNITVYGHNNRNNYSVKFASLNNFYNDSSFYRQNAYFNFYLKDEVRRYVICYVFMYSDSESISHQTTNFSEELFDSYFSVVKRKNTISSLDDIEYGENFITLQTCKRGNRQYRLVVIAKEIGRFNYD